MNSMIWLSLAVLELEIYWINGGSYCFFIASDSLQTQEKGLSNFKSSIFFGKDNIWNSVEQTKALHHLPPSLSDSSSHILDSMSPNLWRAALKHPALLLLPELHIPKLFSSTQLGPWLNDFIVFSLLLKEQVTKQQKHTNKICTSSIHRILNIPSFRHIWK